MGFHEERIKHRLVRLVHVLLTHTWDRSVSKEVFGRRCAWTVEEIIDEIENPKSTSDMRTEVIAERIRQRIARRTENDWAEVDSCFAAAPETAEAEDD